MGNSTETPWLRCDYRRDSIVTIIVGLTAALKEIQDKLDLIPWYDGLWAYEEAEPIFGLAFIAIQNYVNKSIADYDISYNVKQPKHRYYKLDTVKLKGGRTCLEMIIALANYSKHEEEGSLHTNTRCVLDDLSLKYSGFDVFESPIFKGIELVTNDWELNRLLNVALEWRENIWNNKAFQKI
jgi:hypothetical protein